MQNGQAVKVEISSNSLRVFSPYHPDFPACARRLGGRWDAASKAWTFDARDEARVRDLCREIYGSDGSAAAEADLVTLRLTATEEQSEHTSGIYLVGRCLAHATGRDSGARLGGGVVLLRGGAHSGGSVKNWRTEIRMGSVLEVRDVPRAAAQTAGSAVGWSVEIIEQTENPRAAVIEAARVALAALTQEERALLIAQF